MTSRDTELIDQGRIIGMMRAIDLTNDGFTPNEIKILLTGDISNVEEKYKRKVGDRIPGKNISG